MIPYLPCHRAWDLLEPFADGELATAEQVLVEAHLRWCETCRARVEDIRLIGEGLRAGAAAHQLKPEVRHALASIADEVLARVEAERDQSVFHRCREAVTDTRFVWPALGATAALVVFMYAATAVSRLARAVTPNSMAAVIEILANPGSDANPLYLDEDMLAPRGLFAGEALAAIPEEEAAFAIQAVVTREGRISNYEVLSSSDFSADTDAVRAMVVQSRFHPAQTPGGAVAVNVVWLLTRTTVKGSPKAQVDVPVSGGLVERPVPRPARL